MNRTQISQPQYDADPKTAPAPTPPISTRRIIIAGKLRINITSIFVEAGQPISDKLYTIANRKIKGAATFTSI